MGGARWPSRPLRFWDCIAVELSRDHGWMRVKFNLVMKPEAVRTDIAVPRGCVASPQDTSRIFSNAASTDSSENPKRKGEPTKGSARARAGCVVATSSNEAASRRAAVLPPRQILPFMLPPRPLRRRRRPTAPSAGRPRRPRRRTHHSAAPAKFAARSPPST